MAALLDLRMPGVYTQEIPTLPPTVGVIPSAVPVFIGYTEKADKKGESLLLKPTRVKSMKEFESWFGGPPLVALSVDIDDQAGTSPRPDVRVVKPVAMDYKMYFSMLFYYANGGGPCWVVSVGDYKAKPKRPDLEKGIPTLLKVKDITIIVYPDGTSLAQDQYFTLISNTLIHCEKVKNRVTVIDVHDANGEDLTKIETGFQSGMPNDIDFKKYGMAYYPYIDTVFSYDYDPATVRVRNHWQTFPSSAPSSLAGDLKTLTDALGTANTNWDKAVADAAALKAKKALLEDLNTRLTAYKTENGAATNDDLKTKLEEFAGDSLPDDVKTELAKANPDPLKILTDFTPKAGDITTAETAVTTTKAAVDAAATAANAGVDIGGGKKIVSFANASLAALKAKNDLYYSKINDAILNFPVTLPPCGAIAGIYVRTDATQGVWRAPANVSVFGGIKPALEIDDDLHAELNAPSSGKSINVLRAYPGRGLLVYGARTLAGNDLEWRYVNVRRTFCFIEDSIARAMQDFVFAPNNEQTWIKVRAMIRSFLNRLWKAGGLFGNTPEDAYEVVASEPESMSVDDVLNGIMRIYVKVAVARPAEFIVLQYEHKFEVTES